MSGTKAPVIFPLAGKRIWVAGHRGMVGSALVRRLEREACTVLTVDRQTLDLRDQKKTRDWLSEQRPDAVFIAAALVGGIAANSSRPAEFLYDNLAIASNIVQGAAETQVKKLMFLGAACLYPAQAPQPMAETSLLQGPPEPTNEWFSVAKIAGVKLCEAYRRQHGHDFVSAVLANLYGPGDRFDTESGHVVPGLMMRAQAAKDAHAPELPIWGSGRALREFMHVDDCADALVFLMQTYSEPQVINAGTGEEVSIAELAQAVCEVVGFTGELVFDRSKPEGVLRKRLDSSRVEAMGWRPRIALKEGLRETYQWYVAQNGRSAVQKRVGV